MKTTLYCVLHWYQPRNFHDLDRLYQPSASDISGLLFTPH